MGKMVYECGFCNHKFEKKVERFGSDCNMGSTIVECPNCHNYLKTWNKK